VGPDPIVIAHTLTDGEIETRFDGRVVMIDVGISAAYGGHLVSLLIEDGRLYSVTLESRTPLAPAD
jgi:hypothetical protein